MSRAFSARRGDRFPGALPGSRRASNEPRGWRFVYNAGVGLAVALPSELDSFDH
jgi:hypothetical protein